MEIIHFIYKTRTYFLLQPSSVGSLGIICWLSAPGSPLSRPSSFHHLQQRHMLYSKTYMYTQQTLSNNIQSVFNILTKVVITNLCTNANITSNVALRMICESWNTLYNRKIIFRHFQVQVKVYKKYLEVILNIL